LFAVLRDFVVKLWWVSSLAVSVVGMTVDNGICRKQWKESQY